ncbi:hypothetical protein RhiirA5_437602 [Rhizophagus irregularis]|uniref:Uncharacterized protein n=1 Tax=Rhizophagus irregularis TaxID=588596 RepID=A0A2N0NK89_9GLOM|nr:hypothetical protein RhiirA5_437602 [Rhizophagus irregularis]
MELNINTLETQKIVKNWLNISENDKVETVFEPRIFELNETDISDFDEFESEIKENKNNDYESDIVIDRRNECNPVCNPAFKDIKNSRYICSKCYKLEGSHFHVKPGKGKISVTCFDQKYHDQDVKKIIDIIACWLFYIKNNKDEEYQNKVLEIFLPLYFQCLNENYLNKINTNNSNTTQPIATFHYSLILSKLPTFFIVHTLTRLNQIPIYPNKKELEEEDFERLGEIAGNKLWQ